MFLDFLASVNIHVIKINTRTLTDVWHILFSDPTDINIMAFQVFFKTPTLYVVTAEATKTLGKNGGQAVIPGNLKRRFKRSPYNSGILFY